MPTPDEQIDATTATQAAKDDPVVAVPRWWLERVRDCLGGALPAGRIGDAVFVLRDQIGDLLAAPPGAQPSLREIAEAIRDCLDKGGTSVGCAHKVLALYRGSGNEHAP